jgi:hypothetical protein
MKLGEFIEKFSHNNVIRLLYKDNGVHRVVLDNWNDTSMDWEVTVNNYINNGDSYEG